jgi:glycosyltransferase involved in cell wall biosynthesis
MINRQRLALLIPAYNAADYLPRLFQSVQSQTEPFDEVWVYDDCSTDKTLTIAEGHGAHVVRGDINRGCTHGKSVLVKRTNCEWVHFHDADDLLLPNFVACARRWLDHEGVDVIVFGCEERWEKGGDLISVSLPDDALLAADPIGYTINHKINAISSVYSRIAFLSAGGFDLDPEVHFNEDEACHCKLARAGVRFRGDPTVTVVNLRRQTSMWTANRDKALRARYHVMRKALAGPNGQLHKLAIAKELWLVVAGAASQLDWQTADEAAELAMQLAGPAVIPSGPLFRNLCRLSPRLALRVREWLIRVLKPRLRENYPGWRGPVSFI